MIAKQYPSLAEIIVDEIEVHGAPKEELDLLFKVLGEVNRLMGVEPSKAQEYVDEISAG